MRRPTFITLVVLVVLLLGAGVAQIIIASRDQARYRGPINPTALPSLTGAEPSV